MSESERHGVHPLDEQLHESTMLAWVLPSIKLLIARILYIAPFAAAIAAYAWLAPHLSLSTLLPNQGWLAFVDGVLRTAIMTAITLAGYATLARTEGRPYGVGALLPLPECAVRVAALIVFWSLVGWLIGELVQALASWPPTMRFMMLLVMRFDVRGIYALIIALSPLAFMLAAIAGLTYVGAIRGNQPLVSLIGSSFSLVIMQPRRFVKPALVITTVLILVLHVTIDLLAENIVGLFFQHGRVIALGFLSLIALMTLPWWFVMERAVRPDLGVESDLDPIADDGDASDASDVVAEDLTPSTSPVISDPARDAATLTSTASAPPSPDDTRRRFSAMLDADGPVAAARQLVAELRTRQLDQAGFMAGLDALPANAPVLAQMADLASSWQEAGHSDELAWLVRTGLKRNKAFLMDRPDSALAIAQRLASQQQPQLASHLLLAFVNFNRQHPSHLDAGLRLARLLAFELDNTAGAKHLLDKLEAGYPDNPDIKALRKTLD